jgi:hypothetical protein
MQKRRLFNGHDVGYLTSQFFEQHPNFTTRQVPA